MDKIVGCSYIYIYMDGVIDCSVTELTCSLCSEWDNLGNLHLPRAKITEHENPSYIEVSGSSE